MARTVFGGSPADVLVQVTTDDGDLAPLANTVLTVWPTATGGVQEVDLLDASGAAVTQVTTDALGRVMFSGRDGYAGVYWVQPPSGSRYRIDPADLASRIGGVVTVEGVAADSSGNVDLPSSSTTVAGLVELATNAEALDGTSATLGITPASLAAAVASIVYGSDAIFRVEWNGTAWTYKGSPVTTRPLPSRCTILLVDAIGTSTNPDWLLNDIDLIMRKAPAAP